jgi:hypothetical protein
MPCSDVTELIEVVVDAQDRLATYRFVKRTCGQGVGLDTLLMPVLGGQPVDTILAWDLDAFLEAHPAPEGIEEFLALKHLVAVQAALQVMTGAASGGPGDLCAAAEVEMDEDGHLRLLGQIAVDLVTEHIASCGNCKGCGKTKTKKVKPVFA